MRIAFYAPLKAPDRGAPSGDRRIARSFVHAFRLAGHKVCLASRFRSREGRGDPVRQAAIRAAGLGRAHRIARRWLAMPTEQRPQLWFTYHLYYKAPDWLGPLVADALAIPYVVAEASHAPKRDRPPWQMAHRAAASAIRRADAVVTLNSDDLGCLRPVVSSPGRLLPLPPFIEVPATGPPGRGRDARRRRLALDTGLDPDAPWIIAVAMMRSGDKLASYRALAAALTHLTDRAWQLLIVGDGDARAEVASLLAPFGGRVALSGRLDPEAVRAAMAAADLLVWPAVNEAFGMVFLEAQAEGLAVVAGKVRGVPDVVEDGVSGLLVAPDDPVALARAVRRLLDDPALRRTMGSAGRERVRERHSIEAASTTLDRLFERLVPKAGDG